MRKIMCVGYQNKAYVATYNTRSDFTMVDHDHVTVRSNQISALERERLAQEFDRIEGRQSPLRQAALKTAVAVVNHKWKIVLAALGLAIGLGLAVYFFHAQESQKHAVHAPREQVQAPAHPHSQGHSRPQKSAPRETRSR